MELCGYCRLPIHRDDAKDYYGTFTAHRKERCIELLRAAVARAEQEREQDRKDLGDHHDWPTTILVCQANAHAVQMNREEIERLRSRVAAIRAETVEECCRAASSVAIGGDYQHYTAEQQAYSEGLGLAVEAIRALPSLTIPAPGGADQNQEGGG